MEEDAKNLEGIFQEELQKPDVEGETAEDGDSSTPEVGTETPQQDEDKSSEDAALQDLDQDEDFKKTTKEFQKELGSQPTLGQLKAWKKTYWRAKEAEREKESLSKRIAELEAKELEDDEVLELARKRGLVPEEQATPPAQQGKGQEFDWDNVYLNATPEQRAWLDIIDKRAEQKISAIEKELGQYRTRFGALDERQTLDAMSKMENDARSFVKEKYKLDYDKDIVPEIQKKIKELRQTVRRDVSLAEAGYNPLTLTKLVLAEKGAELARIQVLEQEKKKKASLKNANLEVESETITSESDTKKDLEELWKEESRKAGITSFL